MNTFEFSTLYNDHRFGESATGSIARFSAPLDCVAPPCNMQVAASSLLAKGAEKRTLDPVQLPFLG